MYRAASGRSRSTSKRYDAGRRAQGTLLQQQHRAELARLHDQRVEPLAASEQIIKIEDELVGPLAPSEFVADIDINFDLVGQPSQDTASDSV
jgi:hypothetical protein